MKKSFTSADKAKIALEAIKEVDSLAKIGSVWDANPIQVGLWKKTLLTRSHELFDKTNSEAKMITALTDLLQWRPLSRRKPLKLFASVENFAKM